MLADASLVLKAIYNPPASNLGVHLAAVIDSSIIPESNSKRERLAPSAHPCHLRHITMVETCLIPTARCPSLLVHGSQTPLFRAWGKQAPSVAWEEQVHLWSEHVLL